MPTETYTVYVAQSGSSFVFTLAVYTNYAEALDRVRELNAMPLVEAWINEDYSELARPCEPSQDY